MGVDLVTAGLAEGERAVVVADAEAGTYRKLVTASDGRVLGAVLLGDARGAELLVDQVRTGERTDDPLELLARASQATAAELPDTAQVCNCNGVCKGAIVDAIRERGLGSTQEVVSVTRAGAGCGSCKPIVSELLTLERDGAAEEPAYLCPCRRQTREQLAQVVRERELTSVGELADACGAGPRLRRLQAGPGLPRLRAADRAASARSATRGSSTTASTRTSRTTGPSASCRGSAAACVTPDELRRIADVADKYELPMVKITGGQRIDLLGARKEQLPAIWEDLGMPSGHAYAKAVRTVKTCVGTDFCRFGLGDAIGVGIELERAMEGLHTPHKVKSAVTGCPRNCAEAYVKDIGLVAVEGGWEIYVGGAAGGTVRKGDLLTTVESEDEAIRLALVFLQHYREQGEHLERTYGYLERVGIEAVREVVLDPGRADGAARALPDREGGVRSGPVARAQRAGAPEAVRRARHASPSSISWRWRSRSR